MTSFITKSRYPTSLHDVRQDLDRWFDHFFTPAGEAPIETRRAPAALWEDENHFRVEVELPGVLGDDIDVTFEKGVLLVTAEHKSPEEDRKVRHNDRYYGKYQLRLRLPDSVDGENVDAELKNGILHLALAKLPEAQPKKITVKTTE